MPSQARRPKRFECPSVPLMRFWVAPLMIYGFKGRATHDLRNSGRATHGLWMPGCRRGFVGGRVSPQLVRGQPPPGQLLFSGALSGAVCPRSLFEASLLEASFFSPGLCRGLCVPQASSRPASSRPAFFLRGICRGLYVPQASSRPASSRPASLLRVLYICACLCILRQLK